MSSATATRFNASASAYCATSAKKFCGVCQKKGLPESVYTSHFTKSVPGDKGIVTCPTILSASCTYCGAKGHWANDKFCSAMRSDAKKAKASANANRVEPMRSAAPTVVKVTANRFDILNDDAALSAAPSAAPSAASLVPVVKPVAAKLPIAGVSWASMAGRPAAPVAPADAKAKPDEDNDGFAVLKPPSRTLERLAIHQNPIYIYCDSDSDYGNNYDDEIYYEEEEDTYDDYDGNDDDYVRPRDAWD